MRTPSNAARSTGWLAAALALGAGLAAAAEPAPYAPGAPTQQSAPGTARPTPGAPVQKMPLPEVGFQRVGTATIYRERIVERTTASGEMYNRNGLNAAHRSLPFGTLVRVTNLSNQRQVVVRVNDRGSNIGNRVIELTPRAAALIGLHGISTGEVRLDVLGASPYATTEADAAAGKAAAAAAAKAAAQVK